MGIAEFLDVRETVEQAHTYTLACQDPKLAAMGDLARVLAIRIMQHRLTPRHFGLWQARFNGGVAHVPKERAAIVAFTRPAFGLPEGPDVINIDHLEGLVSQYLWYFTYKEICKEEIIRDIPPGFKATDPGGDALMIHRLGDGTIRFRLWEIKKYVQRTLGTSNAAASVISRAYQQLEDNAEEYLARYTTIGQELNPELNDFFGRLVELWTDADPSAAAGVSLNTSVKLVPQDSFHDFESRFPGFVKPTRLCGMISAVEDFALFSIMVRDFVWKGL